MQTVPGGQFAPECRIVNGSTVDSFGAECIIPNSLGGDPMPLPKYKICRSHSRSRRAANFLSQISAPEMNRCPKCGTLKRMHFACQACGFYAGRQVFTKRERSTRNEEE